MMISDLADYLAWLPALARWHYDQWGPLTGAGSFDGYVALLTEAAASKTEPSVLVAVADGELRVSYFERERTVMDYDVGLSSTLNHGMQSAAGADTVRWMALEARASEKQEGSFARGRR